MPAGQIAKRLQSSHILSHSPSPRNRDAGQRNERRQALPHVRHLPVASFNHNNRCIPYPSLDFSALSKPRRDSHVGPDLPYPRYMWVHSKLPIAHLAELQTLWLRCWACYLVRLRSGV